MGKGNVSLQSRFSGFNTAINQSCKEHRGKTTLAINALAIYAIYNNPRNLMVFCAGAGAMAGSIVAWVRDAEWTNIIYSTLLGAGLGALSAKFLPEQMGKVQKCVMGFFGVKFADSASTADVNSDVLVNEPGVSEEVEIPASETVVQEETPANEPGVSEEAEIPASETVVQEETPANETVVSEEDEILDELDNKDLGTFGIPTSNFGDSSEGAGVLVGATEA